MSSTRASSKLPGRAFRQRASALCAVYFGHHGKTEGHRPHYRRLSTQCTTTMKWVFDLREEDIYWCTRRHRLGHRTQLHRLRAALSRRDHDDVRRRARFPATRPFLEALSRNIASTSSTLRRRPSARFDAAGRSVAERARSFEFAAAGVGGRADQSGGVGVVSPGDRQRALPDCRYVVADGNRGYHDRADAGSSAAETGVGNASDARSSGRRSSISKAIRAGESGRIPDSQEAVAKHGAHAVGRSGTLQAGIIGSAFRAST